MGKSQDKGKEYEKLAQEVVQALNSKKRALHDVKIVGKLSEVERQIDVKLENSDYDFVVYECKNKTRSVDIGAVGKLLSDLEDVGATKGAIISNSPFTKGARNLAKKKGVDLLHLIKTDNPLARGGISAKVLVKDKHISQIAFGVRDRSFNSPILSMDPDVFLVVASSGTETLRDFIAGLWNDKLSKEYAEGEHHLSFKKQRIVDVRGNEYVIDELTVTLIVEYRYFEDFWEVETAQGLYNINEGSFHAYGNLSSKVMSIEHMQENFQPVSEETANGTQYSIMLETATHHGL